MENQKTGWFSIVPIAAALFIFIGWNLHGNTSGAEKKFESDEVNITFEYSREWIKSDNSGIGISLIRLDNPSQKVHITKLRKPMVGMSLAQNSYNANVYADYQKTSEEKLEVAGAKSLRIDYTYNAYGSGNSKLPRQASELVVDLGDYVAVITYSAPENLFKSGVKNFETIVETLEIR